MLNPGRYGWVAWFAVFAIALAWRIALVSQSDALYSWDALFRMYHRDHLFVSHWLPLPQLPIYVAHRLGSSLFALQSFYALVAATGIAVTGYAVALLSNARFGLAAGLLLAVLPQHSIVSIVPYQEPVFLLLFSGFIAAWQKGRRAERPGLFWLAGALLGAAALCRYEAWLFAAVFASGLVVRKRRNELLYVLPAALAMLGIAVVRALHEPPADPGTVTNVGQALQSAHHLDSLAFRMGRAACGVLTAIGRELLWVGVAAAVLGAVAFRRAMKGMGVELAVFTLAILLLAVVRAAVTDVTNPRMVLLVCFISTPFALAGVHRAFEWLPLRTAPRLRCALVVVSLLTAAAFWLVMGWEGVHRSCAPFREEAALAAQLEELPSTATVLLAPKWSPLEYGVGAVFANTLELDPKSERWLYGDERIGRYANLPDYFVYWSRKGYVIKRLTDREKESFRADPTGYRRTLVGDRGR